MDAVKLCFDRPAEFVTEYMEENFKLGPQEMIAEAAAINASASQPVPSGVDGEQPAESSPEGEAEAATAADALSDETSDDAGESKEGEVFEDSGEPAEPSANGANPHHERPSPRPARLTIIERFARANGFEKDSDDRFFHPDGSFIAKPPGLRFWERRTRQGDLIRYYWPKDHCLQHEPLQLEADIWGLIDKNPDTYALVLSDLQERPVEITGARLRAMCSAGEIKLYPATYRLVYQDAIEH